MRAKSKFVIECPGCSDAASTNSIVWDISVRPSLYTLRPHRDTRRRPINLLINTRTEITAAASTTTDLMARRIRFTIKWHAHILFVKVLYIICDLTRQHFTIGEKKSVFSRFPRHVWCILIAVMTLFNTTYIFF